ncbi:MAG: copper amine oxidase N-terminal domain-containing protein [Oscillospiraceae bacterium]|nr:copper amine oxidase N-terminal domain-containing protein [Oscillospiraceae bacterium]
MTTFKKLALLLLALLLALTLVACNNDNGDDEYDYDEDGYVGIEPPIGDISDMEIPDWSLYPVIIDGVGVPGATIAFDPYVEDIFPTHVSLINVAEAMGASVEVNGDEVALESLTGDPITFTVGGNHFRLNGGGVELNQSTFLEGGTIYVPMDFFRDVFGAEVVFFSGGHVYIYIDSVPDDMY